MSARIDMEGQRFGRWTVIGYAGDRRWDCRCDCGTERSIEGKSLRNGSSGGCIRCHPAIGNRTTHGQRDTRLYTIWSRMKGRCDNPADPAYGRYGGRGIQVCADWKKFEAFAAWAESSGYREDLSIDRRDNDAGYAPENCRWATARQQMRNTRKSAIVKFDGREMTIAELSEVTGVGYDLLKQRIRKYGWTPKRAVSEPSRAPGRRK